MSFRVWQKSDLHLPTKFLPVLCKIFLIRDYIAAQNFLRKVRKTCQIVVQRKDSSVNLSDTSDLSAKTGEATPQPRTQNTELRTQNSEHRTLRTQNSELRTQNSELRT